MSVGNGSLTYNNKIPDTSGLIAAADDGLSVETPAGVNTVRLGQITNNLAGPAKFNEDRFIPQNGHQLQFIDANGADIAIAAPLLGISGQNPEIIMQDLLSANDMELSISVAGATFVFSGSNVFAWDANTDYFTFNRVVVAPAFAPGIRQVSGVVNVLEGDTTLIVDTSAGNATINIDPATNTRIMNIRKLGTDSNTITIHAVTGTINKDGVAAANASFSSAGESLSVQSDLTNLYVI
jgi:hypothetical protein